MDMNAHPNALCDQSGPETCWTTNNVSEALPGVVTPMTWSLFGSGSEIGTRRAICRMGIFPRSEVRRDAPVDQRFFGVFYGRAALNVDTYRHVADLAPGMSAESSEKQLLGSSRDGVASHPTMRRLPMIAAKLPPAFLIESRRIRAVWDEQRAWWQSSVVDRGDPAGPDAGRSLLNESAQRLARANEHHTFASMIALALVGQIETLCEGAGHGGLERTLASGYGGYEEEDFLTDLWRLAGGQLERDQFIRRYGFYGPAELAAPSWRVSPATVDVVAARFRDDAGIEGPAARIAQQSARREDAEKTLHGSLPFHRRAQAQLVLALARRGIPLREVGKAAYLMAIDGARAACESIGHHWAGEGALDSADDVHLLTLDEALRTTRPDPGLVRERRELIDEYRSVEIPQTWSGMPETTPAAEPAGDGAALDGIPVTAGVVVARACVATSVDEAHAIRTGDVLICRTTDPSWVPAFTLAAGLAIDIGSTASHGAIMARELGIPCVINTRTGTETVRTGDLVRLDGAAGTIEILEAVS